jgi:hypothetical protein
MRREHVRFEQPSLGSSAEERTVAELAALVALPSSWLPSGSRQVVGRALLWRGALTVATPSSSRLLLRLSSAVYWSRAAPGLWHCCGAGAGPKGSLGLS